MYAVARAARSPRLSIFRLGKTASRMAFSRVSNREHLLSLCMRSISTGQQLRAEAVSEIQGGVGAETSGLPASTDLLEVYRGLVATGRLRWDDEQVRCVIKLRDLLESLEDYEPPIDLLSQLTPSAPFKMQQDREKGSSWWKGKGKEVDGGELGRDIIRVLSGEEELANLKTPKGVLITGPPGTGKSLLLSLFFSLLPTTKKRRVHYHAFTLQLYRQVFKEMQRRRDEVTEDGREDNRDVAATKGWRAVFAGGRWDTESGQERRGWRKEDTIPFVIARDMILEYHVLYFDELQLVDASSAALLRDVLSWYWRLGGVIVSCSNRVPDDLYYHGIQRERMAGFLDALKSRCDVIELDGGRDWRRGTPDTPPREPSWYTDSGPFEKAWTQAGGDEAAPHAISVYSRPLHIPQAVGKTCRFTFAELCENALGPADYLSLASTFDTFYIDQVPILLLKAKNEARRLINLVDALYESRCQVYIQAAAAPEDLFFPDALDTKSPAVDGDQILAEALSETLHAPARPNVSVYNYSPSQDMEAPKIDASKGKVNAFSVLSIFTGEDERFAYKRAVSRLIEMTTSPTYPAEEWLPLGVEGRTWEGKASTLASTAFPSMVASLASEGDFAIEAGYSRPHRLSEASSGFTHSDEGAGPRHDPPRIKEEHVWGVAEEWGEKAGKWGKGPRAYKKNEEE